MPPLQVTGIWRVHLPSCPVLFAGISGLFAGNPLLLPGFPVWLPGFQVWLPGFPGNLPGYRCSLTGKWSNPPRFPERFFYALHDPDTLDRASPSRRAYRYFRNLSRAFRKSRVITT